MMDTSLNDKTPRSMSERSTERLDSWKEIAAFFRREVRTVQLWEKSEGLPVKRHHHIKLGSVYAYRHELESWWASRCSGHGAPQVDSALTPGKPKLSTFSAEYPRSEDPGPAYHASMMGLYFWKQRTRVDLLKAVGYYQEALLLDPTYADAYAGLADTYVSLSYNHLMPARQAMESAKRAVDSALALDPHSINVRNAEINFRANCAWEWAAAERLCQSIVETGLVNSRTFQLYASLMINLGRHDEAIRLSLHAHRLDPLSDIVNSQVSFSYFYAGDYDNSIAFINRAIELRPQFSMGHALLGRTHAERGNWEQAIRSFERGLEVSTDSALLKALIAYGHAGLGDSDRASEILQEIEADAGNECFPAYDVSAVYALLKRQDQAVEHISRAYEMHDIKMTYIQYDPRFKSLRSLPQIQQITASMFPVPRTRSATLQQSH
ncbi:tetratricopeptide repeat protein [Granulicella aggregans]|uniref:tetratricopeptide repeat protein n=1 Tax=Granulicella aggregans TaxID=474949 RepID=UPI0021E01243|nr:hypothetical protein [Granulicella aggregans]